MNMSWRDGIEPFQGESMKRTLMMAAILAVVSSAIAQQTPAAQSTTPAAQPTTAASSPQQGKRPPQAKTQPEFDAYQAAVAGTDPAILEKNADDFAVKFPDSELRTILYRNVMRSYQNANNGDKMLDVGRKILKLDPDDPEALIGVAEVLTERTRDTDLDKDQRYEEAMQAAQRSIQTVDTDIIVPAGTPQEKVDTYKSTLRSTAYSIIGAIQLNSGKYTDAETSFHKSIDAYPSSPDPVVVLRLAIALDKQNKYPEALKEAIRAVELTQDNTSAGVMARRERDRLVQLTGGAAPPPASAAPAPKSPGI
jgi:tetratricopeptide (TPR) repeat protein